MLFRLKTILGILTIQLVLLLIVMWNSFVFLKQSTEAEFVNRSRTAVVLFSTMTKNGVLSTNIAELENFANEALKNPGLKYARVLDDRGRVLAEAGDSLLLQRNFMPDDKLDHVNDGIFDTYADISEMGVIYGRVEIGISVEQYKLALNKMLQDVSLIIMTGLLVSGILSFMLGSYLVRQLDILKEASAKISRGDLGYQIDVRGKDEIAQTAAAFNEMSRNLKFYHDQIHQAEAQVREARDKLEIRVRERTAELKNMQEQLIQSEKLSALGNFTASIAHEFNNPIFGIKMALEEILESSNLNKDERSSMSLALKECNRVSKLVESLQTFYQPANEDFTLMDVHQLIDEMLVFCRNKLMAKDIEIKKEYAKDIPQIPVVSNQMKQVFLNIVSNAEEAMVSPGGRLIIKTQVINDKVYISFKDTGHGIAPQNIRKIFDPFFTTKSTVKGIGLGLSVSYGIVKKHGGNILVESTPNQGSTFTVELPINYNTPPT